MSFMMDRSRIHGSPVRAVLAFLLICILQVPSTDGQVIGTDICACSPSTFTFRFDFSLSCPPVNVTIGDGIKATACIIVPLDPSEDITDEVPVVVTTIQVSDLDLNSQILSGPENIMGEFEDGDNFTYTSDMALGADTLEELAGGLQMSLTGTNAAGQPLSAIWSMQYSNECGVEPILNVGDSAGWVVFEDLTPPRQDLCPGATTEAPSLAPVPATDPPTSSFAPSSVAPVVTDPPTVAPVTGPPSEAPVSVAPVTEPPTDPPATPQPVTEPPTTPPPVTDPPTPPPVPVPSPPVAPPPTDGPEPQPTPRPPTTPPPPTMSMSFSMSFDVRRMEEAMNEAELFEFGRAI